MGLRAAVFDFDGVIVDSEPLHFRSLQDALLSEGVRITREEYWGHLLAYDDRGSIRHAFERHGEPLDPARLGRVEQRKVERFAELIPEIGVFPGARELVGALAGSLPLAIASGARRAGSPIRRPTSRRRASSRTTRAGRSRPRSAWRSRTPCPA